MKQRISQSSISQNLTSLHLVNQVEGLVEKDNTSNEDSQSLQ
ncbi:24261_t:CDS:2, partial [Racocetra persica]